MAKEQATYTHGHSKAVVADHSRRTAADSAAFLLPHLQPDHRILDLGCGPGSITVDLAALVPQGHVTGGDAVGSVLDQARELAASRSLSNIDFQVVDGNALPYPDNSFDVVFCHQTLQHVHDPVGILREMRRVAKVGGIVAAREADFGGFCWYPESALLDKWSRVYQASAQKNGGTPRAGRYLHAWAEEAGFETKDVQGGWSNWRYEGERAIAFSESWATRTVTSGTADTAKREGIATAEELEEISDAWRTWSSAKSRLIVIPSGEIIARKT